MGASSPQTPEILLQGLNTKVAPWGDAAELKNETAGEHQADENEARWDEKLGKLLKVSPKP